MDSKIQKFKAGDKVRILRKAVTHENGWKNSWELVMDKAIGQIGTVLSSDGLQYDVHVMVPAVGSSFGYPSFVLELVPKFEAGQKVQVNYRPNSMWNGVGVVEKINHPYANVKVNGHSGSFYPKELTIIEEPPKKEFKVGDKVRVKYGHGWDGDVVIIRIDDSIYVVRDENGQTGVFKASHLISISAPAEPAPTRPAPAPPVPSLGGFKVGDRVYAPERGEYSNPSTVTKIDEEFVYIKPDNSKSNYGGFYPKNLRFVTPVKTEEQAKYAGVAGAVKSHSKVFEIAKNLAVDIAKRSYGNLVHADLVQEELVKLGYKSTDLGNAAGALFRGKNWKRVQTRKSVRKGNHLREITVWQYVGA
jgi:hypothetical protein